MPIQTRSHHQREGLALYQNPRIKQHTLNFQSIQNEKERALNHKTEERQLTGIQFLEVANLVASHSWFLGDKAMPSVFGSPVHEPHAHLIIRQLQTPRKLVLRRLRRHLLRWFHKVFKIFNLSISSEFKKKKKKKNLELDWIELKYWIECWCFTWISSFEGFALAGVHLLRRRLIAIVEAPETLESYRIECDWSIWIIDVMWCEWLSVVILIMRKID